MDSAPYGGGGADLPSPGPAGGGAGPGVSRSADPTAGYLGADLLAFLAAEQPAWRKPVLALELENREEPEAIAYALWKVCAVRVAWGGVFCYRREPIAIGELLRALSDGVMRLTEPEHDVLLVVGTRSRAGDFPDGFFKPYVWDKDFRQFRSL